MKTEKAQRRLATNALRIGSPAAPLSDLYYSLMEGSWLILFVLFVGAYLLANVAFAVLYMAQANAISAAHEGSFADAFFFSVQTLSTIGYGTLAPQSAYAHALVTAEAMLGLLGFAIATGLMFAKFSRPSARVIFTDGLVVSVRNGKPSLMFRTANARGNEVVEASIRFSVLLTEVSAEGHRMRKLSDLKLIRETTPLFVLSWLVIHEIDEDSPLFGHTAESLAKEDALFIVTMTGIDSTFADTVHARQVYDFEDIEWGARFVDIISTSSEGRLQIDFRDFDNTEKDELQPVSGSPQAEAKSPT